MDWIFWQVEYKREVYPYFGHVLWEAQEIQYEWRQSMAFVLATIKCVVYMFNNVVLELIKLYKVV